MRLCSTGPCDRHPVLQADWKGRAVCVQATAGVEEVEEEEEAEDVAKEAEKKAPAFDLKSLFGGRGAQQAVVSATAALSWPPCHVPNMLSGREKAEHGQPTRIQVVSAWTVTGKERIKTFRGHVFRALFRLTSKGGGRIWSL